MGIINVDGHPLGHQRPLPVPVQPLVSPNQVSHTGGHQQVFLLQPQLFARQRTVIRIENAGNRLDFIAVLHRRSVISPVERRQVKTLFQRLRVPQPQRIDRLAAIPHNWDVIGDSQHLVISLILERHLAVPILPVHIAAELHHDGLVPLGRLPGITSVQPGVWHLSLIAVHNLLLEQAKSVADPHAASRHAQKCHGIHKAGGQAAQAAVAKSRVPFQGTDAVQILSKLRQAGTDYILNTQVKQVVIQ